MILLAIETSSSQGSLALLSGRTLLAEETWSETSVRGQHLFRVLPRLLAGARVEADAIDLYVAGRGPGSYSGLRVAVMAAQALALPGQRRVFTVSSGAALALEILEREKASTVAIVGDARRGTLWLGVFRSEDRALAQVTPWSVVDVGQLEAALPEDCVVASPDWSRLETALVRHNIRLSRWIKENRCPKASWVGRLAVDRLAQGATSEPLTPIYMHPAVAADAGKKGRST